MPLPPAPSPASTRASKLDNAHDDLIRAALPAWLRGASVDAINSLRDEFTTLHGIQTRLRTALHGLEPLDAFATRWLERSVTGVLPGQPALAGASWRETRLRLEPAGFVGSSMGLPDGEVYYVRTPALQRLMQNFEAGVSFWDGTALVATKGDHVLSDDPARLARLCRELDVGRLYQEHLAAVFTPAVEALLAREQRQSLAVATQVAALKQQLQHADRQLLELVIAGEPLTHRQGIAVRTQAFAVMGYQVSGALVFELLGDWASPPAPVGWVSVQGVLLYLPGDPQPLQRFASWNELATRLGLALRDPGYRERFCHRLALADRAGFVQTLGKRLTDPRTDPQPGGTPIIDDPFAWLARAHVRRVKADARYLAVPSAEVDQRASAARIRDLQSAGLVLLNLAGLFVPAVSLVLMSQLVTQTLAEVFEGVADWSQGHHHEALEHLLGVAETLGVTVALGAGTHVIARGFNRSAWVDGMEPVTTVDGKARLQVIDLRIYRVEDPPQGLKRHDNGLLVGNGRYWWHDQGAVYEVRPLDRQWQLRHPGRDEGVHPLLRHNGERGWRLERQRPLEWRGGQRLLAALWPQALDMPAVRVEQILQVADVDEAQLRGLLVENRRLPVHLRDTLERFAADARIEAFLRRAATGALLDEDKVLLDWCLERFSARSWPPQEQLAAVGEHAGMVREGLLVYLSQAWVPAEPLMDLVQRDFPGLPDAYAWHLLDQATAAQRTFMVELRRVPLAVAEQARPLLQQARLTRVREAFHLRGSYHDDAVGLAFDLLRRHAGWPRSANLELRRGADTGPLLARLYPDGVATILVHREGRFRLFTQDGYPSALEPAEPSGLGEVLAACLPAPHRERLGWHGADAPRRIRQALARWLPGERQSLMRLLGMRPLKPWMHAAWRQPDGRIGYRLSGVGPRTGESRSEQLLRQRIRSLYPSFDDARVQAHLERLLDMTGSPFVNLLSEEQAYRDLCANLTGWVTQDAAHVRPRERLAEQLRRCWRREGERLSITGTDLEPVRLALIGSVPGSLPMLPINVTFPHVTELVLIGLGLQHMPQRFLRAFPQVRWLNLTHNRLTALPAELPQLRRIRSLWLHNNQIRLDSAGQAMLRHMPQLEVLDLSDNPLGSIELNLSGLSRLREVHLRHTELEAVPVGIHWRGLLEWADLRDNRIVSLPPFMRTLPMSLRRRIRLDDNPLSAADVALLQRSDALAGRATPTPGEPQAWLDGLEPHEQTPWLQRWDALYAEPGSGDFFALLDALADSSDFRHARADLRDRLGRMLEAMVEDQRLREELFSLASAPRTCADSTAGSFSNLEIREWLHRALRSAAPADAQRVRLDLARRLFRLEKVEQLAREHMQRQSEGGHEVDEVEVSLAYRTGLAQSLALPGQPRTLHFAAVSDVTQADLDVAVAAVRHAEAGEDLAGYVAGRDFWQEYLRQRHALRFEEVEQPFWEQLEALERRRASLGDGDYLDQVQTIAGRREQAISQLFAHLTEQALAEASMDDTVLR